jgi:hypothetical protein
VVSDFSSGADHLPSPPAMPTISHTGRRSSMSIAGECRRLANGLSSHAGNRHSTPEGSWSYGITRSVQCSMISDMNLTLMPSWSAVLAKYRNTDLPGAGRAGCNDGEKVSVWHRNRGRPRSRRTQNRPASPESPAPNKLCRRKDQLPVATRFAAPGSRRILRRLAA